MNKTLDAVKQSSGYRTVRVSSTRSFFLSIDIDIAFGMALVSAVISGLILGVIAAATSCSPMILLFMFVVPVIIMISWIVAEIPLFKTEWIIDANFMDLVRNWNNLSPENRERVWPVYEELLPLLRIDTESVRDAYNKVLDTTNSMIKAQERRKLAIIKDKVAGPVFKIDALQHFLEEEQKLLDKYGV